MSEQFSFSGMEPPKLTDRLFFAVLPDPVVTQGIVQLVQTLQREHGLHGQPIDPHKLHVSLLPLGDYPGLPQNLIASVQRVVDALEVHSFTARLDRVCSFSGKADHLPLVLRGSQGETGFIGLYAALLDVMQVASSAMLTVRNFTPHLTVLYGPKFPDAEVEPIEWHVSDFVLLRSHIGNGLPYDVLGRWRLRD
jgi:2'-5' RNA ligase